MMGTRLILKVRISLVIGRAQAGSNTGQTPQKKCSIHVLQKGRLKIATAGTSESKNPVAQTEDVFMAQTLQLTMMTNEVGCRRPPSGHAP